MVGADAYEFADADPSHLAGLARLGVPASIGLIVIGYLTIYRGANDSARSVGVFWGEVLVFGIIGPLAAWLLLRQLALDAHASRTAAVQIESLAAEERHRSHEMTALYVVSAAMNQAFSEEAALADAVERVLDVLDLASGRIYVLNPDSDSGPLALAALQGEPALRNPGRRRFSSANASAALPLRPATCSTRSLF